MSAIRPPDEITPSVFAQWRNARRGRGQAEVLTNPLWTWMVETGDGPYIVNQHFAGPSSTQAGPGWTNERFGQSTTVLPDGRAVLVGGEHEDYYDADFFIYNDVIVRHPTGTIDIFGYHEVDFPPTDFHSANLIGDTIVVIGSLGYLDRRRVGQTQVLIVDTTSWQVNTVATTGENPGWIHGHLVEAANGALKLTGGKVWLGQAMSAGPGVLVENGDDWELDPTSWTWRRLTNRGWQQWRIARDDGSASGLWGRRTARLAAGPGGPTDAELVALYDPPITNRRVARGSIDEFNVFRIIVDGVTVRYVEDMGGVQMTIEGVLPTGQVDTLVDDLRSKLEAIDGSTHSSSRLA